MYKPRFSLAWIGLATVLAAVSLAALVSENGKVEFWSPLLFLVTMLSLLAAAVGAVFGAPRRRPFLAGFAIFGGAMLLLPQSSWLRIQDDLAAKALARMMVGWLARELPVAGEGGGFDGGAGMEAGGGAFGGTGMESGGMAADDGSGMSMGDEGGAGMMMGGYPGGATGGGGGPGMMSGMIGGGPPGMGGNMMGGTVMPTQTLAPAVSTVQRVIECWLALLSALLGGWLAAAFAARAGSSASPRGS